MHDDMTEQDNSPSVEDYRRELLYQLGTIDDLDWDYFVETAKKAQAEATRTGRNMVFDAQINH